MQVLTYAIARSKIVEVGLFRADFGQRESGISCEYRQEPVLVAVETQFLQYFLIQDSHIAAEVAEAIACDAGQDLVKNRSPESLKHPTAASFTAYDKYVVVLRLLPEHYMKSQMKTVSNGKNWQKPLSRSIPCWKLKRTNSRY